MIAVNIHNASIALQTVKKMKEFVEISGDDWSEK